MKNVISKKAFYTLNLTWGIIMTAIGALVAVALLVTKHKPHVHCGCVYFEVGKPGWGGMELGLFFLCSPTASMHTKKHEVGHAVQNCKWGPAMPFVICLPSAIRWWYRKLKYTDKGLTPPTAYDDIWFEGEASKLGYELYDAWCAPKESDN